MPVRLIHGDCLEVMPTLDGCSADAVVTDPPYGLGFMGKQWDHGVPGFPFWEAAIRVLKPGGYLAAFGGTRTFHRQVCAIEDAGFEIRDTINCLGWVYGSGFPKGKGCLKPSWEPITLARKPGARVLPLGIDECRVETTEVGKAREYEPREDRENWRITGGSNGNGATSDLGRWPPNLVIVHHPECNGVCHPDCHVNGFPVTTSGKAGADGHRRNATEKEGIYGDGKGLFRDEGAAGTLYGDTGTTARFFPQFRYCPKASRAERDGSIHPTIKPLELMRWLVRLVAREGETVLDPFMGSGTTGKACVLEGRSFVGMEREAASFDDAGRRVESARASCPMFSD